MSSIRGWIKAHALVAYFVLAYVITWLTLPLVTVNPLLGLLGLFGPSLAAVIVSAITEGRAGVGALLKKIVQWRVKPVLYLAALAIPILASLLGAWLSVLIGARNEIAFFPVSVISAVLFFLIIGEELGWRGFALPRLLEKYSPLVSSLILGLVWTFWHTPTFFVEGLPQYGIPVIAYLIYVVSLTCIFTVLMRRADGSLLIALILHGTVNTLGFANNAVAAGDRWWFTAAAYAIAAVAVVMGDGVKRFTEKA